MYAWILWICVCGCLKGDVVPFQQADSSIVPAAEGTQSPACPLRMLDWTSLKKQKTASITRAHYPHHPARTMEHLQTSPSFPRSRSARFPQYCPVLRSCAIVRRPTCQLIVPRRMHTPFTHLSHTTLLVNSLSAPHLHPHWFQMETSTSLKQLPLWACTTRVTGVERALPLIANLRAGVQADDCW